MKISSIELVKQLMKLGRITDLGLDRIEKYGNGIMIYYKDGTRDSWSRFYLVKLSK